MKKKVLFLGAASFQSSIIDYANSIGHKTISLDNNPYNYGHKISKKAYTNISTLDRLQVLEVAKKEKIDAIISFGSDVASNTVEFVSKHLNLKRNNNETDAIKTLTNKNSFRHFCDKEKIQKLSFCEVFNQSEYKKYKKITDQLQNINLIVKPIDSSGSKGVTKLLFTPKNTSDIKFAFNNAIQFSQSKQIIVEELINKNGNQICGDGIIVNGKVIFIGYGDGHYYDENNYANAPFAESFPSKHDNFFKKMYQENRDYSLQSWIL